MSLWEMIAFVLLGLLVVLLPVGVIGVFASRLSSQQKTGFLVLYAGAVFLVSVLAADVTSMLENRAVVDLILIVAGLAVGLYAGTVLRLR